MKTFYKVISIIFIPLLMPLYGMLLLFQLDSFAHLTTFFKGITFGGTALFTIVLPAIPILILLKKGGVSDFFISKKEERVAPYLFTFLAYVFWAFFLFRTLQMPMYVVGAGVGAAISVFLILLINLKWKISAHMTGMGGLAGGIFGICFRLAINPLWLFVVIIFLSLVVALSRIGLKAHTPSQTLAGFIVGFLSVFLCCLFF